MIGAIRLRPSGFEQHLIARAHKQERDKKSLLVSLTLTALVDMFAVLVIFLLQSFSASPELILAKGLTLPTALSGRELREAPVLAVVGGQVFFDQKPVGEIAAILKKPILLADRLADFRKRWQRSNPGRSFPGDVNLQADRGAESDSVARLMGVLATENFHSIMLAVVGGENGR